MKTVVLCSSAAFYEHVNQLAEELEKRGFTAVVPRNAREMKSRGDYNVESVKTWYENPADFVKKAGYMRDHFDEVARGDIVLVVNDEKKGVPGYIGSNVLLEMGIGFYLNKPIYILNPIDTTAGNYEEVMGMGSIVIEGDLSKIVA